MGVIGITAGPCAYCGGPTEGRYSIHRDGMDRGPEVPLCNEHGGHVLPTCGQIWARIKQRRKAATQAPSKEQKP